MNELEKMADEGKIMLNWSSTAQSEALNNESQNLKRKAQTHIYTINDEDDEFPQTPSKIQNEIFKIMEISSQSSQNDINDALIICEAHKYGAILISNDGASRSQAKGILGRRNELKDYVQVVTPSEALEIANRCI
jgi:N-acetylmuramic acid 6-phosphate (MurNAc-6-P) etherase